MSLAPFPNPAAQNDEIYKKVKRWYNYYMQHRYIPPDSIANLNYNKAPIFYRLFITELDNIPSVLTIAENSRPYIKLTMTFFNKARRKFYGRTYISKPYACVSQNGPLQLADPMNVFFYSTIEKGNENILVVEAQLLEITKDNLCTKEQHLGWAALEVYDTQSINIRRISFHNGTPRLLLDDEFNTQVQEIPMRVSFKVFELQGFEPVTRLFDEAILCGADDTLPGVVGRALPDSLTEEISPPKLEPSIKIFLEDLAVDVPEVLENDIIRNAQLYRTTQFGLTPEKERSLQDVFISERKFLVAYHNTWTAVNSRKFKNFAILHKDPHGKSKTSYVFSGVLDCDGVFTDELANLIFQVDYTIILPKPDGTKATWNLALGWKPFLISNLAGGEIRINEALIKGPGRSPTYHKLYEPNPNMKEVITVFGRINLTKMPRSETIEAMIPTQGGAPNRRASIQKSDDGEVFKLKVLLAEKQKELERIQYQNKQNLEARQRGETSERLPPVRSTTEYVGGDTYNQPIREERPYAGSETSPGYRPAYYDEESDKTRTEIQTIKNMLTEIQVQNKMREDEEQKRYETNRFDMEKLKNIDYYMATMSPTKASGEYGQPQTTTQFHTREISRADKALLVQSGIKGILDNVGDIGATSMEEGKSLQTETHDNFKASVFLIQFLALKASQHAIFRDSIKPLDIGHDNYELPSKVYFTYNFFDLPATKTETISLEKPKDMPHDSASVKFGVPYYLVREAYLKTGTDAKEPILRYEIDPSVNQQYNRHIEFAKYLYGKSLTIDIWDAESLMLFGSVKVPLRELMRQGKQISTFSKEFDIIEPTFMRSKGSLQILLKNVGKQPVNDMPQPRIAEKTGKQMFDTKKKVKSKHKVNLPEEFKSGTIPISRFQGEEERTMSPEQRKQERVNRYKMAAIEMNTNVMMSNEEFQREKHNRELREISNFRDVKKATTLKAALNKQFKDEKTVNVTFGKVEIIPIEVTNFYSYDAAFTIHFDDPDQMFINKPELSVVSNPAEWKYWVERKGFAIPPEWNMISMNANSFVLKSGEKCEILLKFLTLRNYNTEYQKDYIAGRVSSNDARRKTYVATRIIHATVNETNGKVITGVKLELVPSSPVIDHVFRFFEQENRNVTLYLPALYHYSMPPATKPILVLNYPKAVVDWLNDKEIALQLKIPSAQSVLRFNLLAYNDVYYGELLGNWVVEINAYAGVDLHVNIGQLISTKLTLPADITRMVKCYVSHPSIAYFPNPYDKPFTLTPASINAVAMNVRSFSVKTQTVLVNCVDVGTRELVYAWIVRLMGTDPQVTRKYELTVRCGMESNQKFVYENRSTSFCIFEFVSSHPDVLQPVEKNVPIEGGQKENIRIRIARRDEPSIAEVCLFTSDTEEKIFECLLFQIRYVN